MRLMRRETWCINDILSNCVCLCLKAMETFEKTERLLILPLEMPQ